ncbi:hypothetical protein [Vibrio cidicii]|uniref:hypothetical protein n=1 Tax=Vibrio cidicii TaxID=1763883 RepID=UPI0018C1E432|nr:hypothetical protein [Vibrio cidicii]MBG0757371.1 hypothetical protein [Vibrio cidicii]
MKEYLGAVFFVDILGVGALTQGKVAIQQSDFSAHRFSAPKSNPNSEHIFCAKLLMKFRRILNKVMKHNGVKVAQLSDCAFIWSDNADLVLEAAREIMWETASNGVLCRGGMSYGEIVEPKTVNVSLGKFICGKAVTQAVKLEGSGKGARVFIDDTVPSEVIHSIQPEAFRQSINPKDYSFVDEFLWNLYPMTLDRLHILNSTNSKDRLKKILPLVSLLRFSPKYRWNTLSREGKVQVASTIDSISSVTGLLQDHFDYHFGCNTMLSALEVRDEAKYAALKNRYLKEVASIK